MGLTTEQQLAVDAHGKNIIVSAGAGSGKTKVLSERVYERLANPKYNWDIDQMLILTFTNAAAANMKSRIRQRLLLENDGNLSKERRQKQLNKIDSSYIMTFDAFAQFLVNKYHLSLEIDKGLKVVDSNIINIKTDELLDEILLEEYTNKDPKFINLVNDFCIKDDNNLRTNIKNLNAKLNSIFDRDSYVENYEDNFYSDEALTKDVEKFSKILVSKLKSLDSMLNKLSDEGVDIAKVYPNYINLVKATTYKEIQAACGIEIGRSSNPTDLAKSLKDDIKDLIKELQELTSLSEEELKQEVLSTKDNVLEYLYLAQRLNNKVQEYKKANNMYEFFDIFSMAIKLVDEHEDIRNEIANQFKEILIDEYQDTNDLQDEFIRRISNNNVYMVGDIKQSIYRFRNANPKLFKEKYESYSNGEGGEKIDLTYNFRSRKEVLTGINDIFNRLMDSEIGGADYTKGHAMNAGNKAYDTEGLGLVPNQSSDLEILKYEYNNDLKKEYPFKDFSILAEIESYIIAKDIEDKIKNKYQVTYLAKEVDENGNEVEVMKTRDVRYEDFTILVDRGSEFNTIKQILTYKGIPCDILDKEDLSASDLITTIRAVFKMLCSIDDTSSYDFRFSYMSLARSFLVEMKDCDIYDVVTNNEFEDSELYKKIAKIHTNIDTKTISEIIDEFIYEFDVYSKITKIGDVHENLVKIDYIYQLANSLNEFGYTYLSFNDYLVGVFDSSSSAIQFKIQKDGNNTVKITNVHQSKGLEYTICYFPLLSKGFNKQDKNTSFVFSKDVGLSIPTMINDRGLKQTIKKSIFNYQYDVDDIGEKIRILYVALTRAKEKTILVCPLEDKTEKGKVVSDEVRLSFDCFTDMLNTVYSDLAKYIKEIDFNDYKDYLDPNYKIYSKDIFKNVKDTNEDIKLDKEAEYVEPQELVKSSFSKKAGLIDESTIEKMELGTKLHYYLETLDFINPDYTIIPDKYRPYIKKFMASDLMNDCKNGKSHREYEFIYEDAGERKHGFIDLLMEYDDHFDIIDYKTKNIDDEHYNDQLNGYRRYIESISDKKVNCYLYSILDSVYREVIA